MTEMTIDPPASPPIADSRTGYRRAARRRLWAGVLLLVLALLLPPAILYLRARRRALAMRDRV